MRAAILFTILWAVSEPSAATSIITARASNAILLGADSLSHTPDAVHSKLVCKIGTNENIIWGVAGLVEKASANFDVMRIAAATLGSAGALEARITKFESAVIPPLTEILNDVKLQNPGTWATLRYDENTAPLEIVVANIENGTPYVYARDFIVNANAITGDVSLKIMRYDNPGPGRRLAFALGKHDAIQSFITDRVDWILDNAPDSIRGLIETQGAATPTDVGGPVSIVLLDRNGVTWLSRGTCADR
jgi:hypothetical protein